MLSLLESFGDGSIPAGTKRKFDDAAASAYDSDSQANLQLSAEAAASLSSRGPRPEPPKKKRIAPINISNDTTRPQAPPIPSDLEPDILRPLHPVATPQDSITKSTGSHLKIGGDDVLVDGSLATTIEDTAQSALPAITLDDTRWNLGRSINFANIKPRPLPVQSRHAKKLIMRCLHDSDRNLAELRDHSDVPMDAGYDDKTLPPLGESDSEGAYDSETWEEIEKEERERQMPISFLTPEEVDKALDDAISGFKQTWTETKLPKLERKAFAIWSQARSQRRRRGGPPDS